MKKSLLLLLLFSNFQSQISNAQFNYQNIFLLSNWTDPTIPAEPVYGIKYNGIWGWHDGAGKEYAIIGTGPGVYFVEVTNPASPQLRDFVQGRRDSCIWREIKTYGNYCYMVSDDGSPNSFQIADMSYLPDSVHLVHDDTTIFKRSHTIWVDGNKLYCGSVKGGTAGSFATMAVYSLANPAQPALIRRLDDDYPGLVGHVHDMFVRNDTVYASCGNDGLYVFKLQSNGQFTLLGSMTTYFDQGYNHSSTLTEDGNYLILCEEVPDNLYVKIVDVSDLSNIALVSWFKSNPGATPHNPFLVGDQVVIAYYQDGVQVFDISNPNLAVKTGFFDTYYQNTGGYPWPAYAGCWGAYPYLPSGVVLASDMQNGLFVLDASAILSSVNEQSSNPVSVFPNPVTDELTLKLNDQSVRFIEIISPEGNAVYQSAVTGNKKSSKHNLSSLAAGSYLLKIISEDKTVYMKIVKAPR